MKEKLPIDVVTQYQGIKVVLSSFQRAGMISH